MATQEQAITMAKDTNRKDIKMPVAKLKWDTEPSGDDAKHSMTIIVNMATPPGDDAKHSMTIIVNMATPPVDDAKHSMTITVNMSTEDRAEVESLIRDYWELDCVLGGTRKPLRTSFDIEPFGANEDEYLSGLPSPTGLPSLGGLPE